MTTTRVAAAVLFVCASYIGSQVMWHYAGNPTGLFYTGSDTALPEELEAEPTWRVGDPVGYDAQFYHLVLHDPLLERGFSSYADNTRLRWRRIGLPGLAALVHSGITVDPHWTYVLIQLVFVFLGARWSAAYSQSVGLPAACGLGFLAVPAVLVSVDRMTVDVALAALAVGMVLYSTRPGWLLYGILCFAPLVRETGMLLIAGWAISNIVQRQWKHVALGAACSLPTLGWWGYVQSRSPHDATDWLASYPFAGVVHRALAGEDTPTATLWLKAAWATEHLAFIGVCLALVCGLLLVRRRPLGVAEITALSFVAFASLLGRPDIWDSAYATGRTMSPLLVLLALVGMRDRRLAYLAPIALILPRIVLQYQAEITALMRAAVRGA